MKTRAIKITVIFTMIILIAAFGIFALTVSAATCTCEAEGANYHSNTCPAYVAPPTGKVSVPYTGSPQLLVNEPEPAEGFVWGYMTGGRTSDAFVTIPSEDGFTPPKRTDVDRYIIYVFAVREEHVNSEAIFDYLSRHLTYFYVTLHPTVASAPVAAEDLWADGTAKTLISSEGVVAGGINPGMLYSVTDVTATAPGSFSSVLPTASKAGSYKVWYKASADSTSNLNSPAIRLEQPSSEAQFVIATVKAPQIKIAEDIEHGTVETSPTEAEVGMNISLHPKPDRGYVVDRVTVTDTSGTPVVVENNSFTIMDCDVTVSATFKRCAHEGGEHEDGVCLECGGYIPAAKNADGYYEIANAGNLFWFAEEVNRDIHDDDGDGDKTFVRAKAILTEDIDLEDRPWIPIGAMKSAGDTAENYFAGIFDGNGKRIEGLYVEAYYSDAGFFGEIRGATVKDFEISGKIVIKDDIGFVGTIGAVGGETTELPGLGESVVSGILSHVVIEVDANAGITDIQHIGGLVGYSNQNPTIEGCLWDGWIILGEVTPKTIGGIVGNIQDKSTTIKNCISYGRVSYGAYSTLGYGGIVGTSQAGTSNVSNCITNDSKAFHSVNEGITISNCYYITRSSSTQPEGTIHTFDARLKSGEIAFRLGEAFGQTLSGDSPDPYPVFVTETNRVYRYVACDGVTGYTNEESLSDKTLEHEMVNGICTECNHLEPATLNGDGYYEIANAGNLYWFAQYVNDGGQLAGADTPMDMSDDVYTYQANAILTENITINENVLSEMAKQTPNTDGFKEWTPIAMPSPNNPLGYLGTFDGAGYTISGLYVNNGELTEVGLFGINGGTVQNVRLVDSYLHAGSNVGGIVGQNRGTVQNCYNVGSVSGEGDGVGGVVGYNTDTVQNCYNVGSVGGEGVSVGGLVGTNGGTVQNCYFDTSKHGGGAIGDGTGTVTNTEGKTAEQFASGEVAYLLGSAFGQDIKTEEGDRDFDALPILGGRKVYYGYVCKEDVDVKIYTNDEGASDTEKPAHDMNEATCLTSATCAVCGHTEGDALGHVDEDTDHICDRGCGKEDMNMDRHIDGEDHDHLCDYGCAQQADDGCFDIVVDGKCDECTADVIHDCTGGEATCEEKAKCAICGREYGALATHIPNEDDGDCTTDIKCSVCDTLITEGAASHTGGTATCVVKAKCEVCNTEYGSLAKHRAETIWRTNETYHYHLCVYWTEGGTCQERLDHAPHADGDHDGKCDACAYQISTSAPGKAPGSEPETKPETNEHDADTSGGSDSDNERDPSDNGTAPSDSEGGLGTGAVICIVSGSVAVVGLGGFSLFWFVIKKKKWSDLVRIFKK